MLTWLMNRSFADVPNWAWGFMLLLFIVETELGRSSDPRWRSLGDAIRNGLGLALAKLPTGGPWIVQILQAIFVVPKNPAMDIAVARARKQIPVLTDEMPTPPPDRKP